MLCSKMNVILKLHDLHAVILQHALNFCVQVAQMVRVRLVSYKNIFVTANVYTSTKTLPYIESSIIRKPNRKTSLEFALTSPPQTILSSAKFYHEKKKLSNHRGVSGSAWLTPTWFVSMALSHCFNNSSDSSRELTFIV